MDEAVDFPLMNHRFLLKDLSANPRIHWGVSDVYVALNQVLLIEHHIALHQLFESHFSKFHNHFSVGLQEFLWISLFILLVPHVDLNQQEVDVHFSQSLRDFCTQIFFQELLKHSGWDPTEDGDVAHDVEASYSSDEWNDSAGLMLVADSLPEIFLLLRLIESLNFCQTVDVFGGDLIGCCWSGGDPDESRGKQLSFHELWHQHIHWWSLSHITDFLSIWKHQCDSAFHPDIKDETQLTLLINLWVQILKFRMKVQQKSVKTVLMISDQVSSRNGSTNMKSTSWWAFPSAQSRMNFCTETVFRSSDALVRTVLIWSFSSHAGSAEALKMSLQ